MSCLVSALLTDDLEAPFGSGERRTIVRSSRDLWARDAGAESIALAANACFSRRRWIEEGMLYRLAVFCDRAAGDVDP